MKRVFATATLSAVVLLLTAVTAVALPHSSVAGKVRPGGARSAAGDAVRIRAHFVPLGVRLAGTTTVSGTVYNSNHIPLSGIGMEWDALVGSDWTYGTGTTDGSGHYSMTADATADGEVYAYPDDNAVFGRGQRTWTAGGSDTVDLYPGRASVVANRGGRWAESPDDGVTLHLFGDAEYSRAFVPAPSETTTASATVDVLDGTYNQGGSVKWFYDEGIEVPGPITITSGTTLDSTIAVNEADAQRMWLKAPYWGSGKPGASVTVARDNFPAGWLNFVSGHGDDPNQSAYKEYGTKASAGGATETFKVTIPAGAKPGYSYYVGMQHVDGSGDPLPLYIEEAYQVCTMKPTKGSIAKGTSIKIKGIVPIQGHWGSRLGMRKTVWILWHKGTAPVPTNWNATKQGWVPVARARTTGTGSYTSIALKPPRTGTFVAQYTGDDWYWGAYTSTAKVTVR